MYSDNYQGEESDIVIVSLTRSNSKGDIGFMFSPERVNVMLSRARNGLIIIGNAATFLKSRNADQAWTPLVHCLREKGHLYDGLPVQCQQHPHKQALLKTAQDFDVECPDGGCSEPWYVLFAFLSAPCFRLGLPSAGFNKHPELGKILLSSHRKFKILGNLESGREDFLAFDL